MGGKRPSKDKDAITAPGGRGWDVSIRMSSSLRILSPQQATCASAKLSFSARAVSP